MTLYLSNTSLTIIQKKESNPMVIFKLLAPFWDQSLLNLEYKNISASADNMSKTVL